MRKPVRALSGIVDDWPTIRTATPQPAKSLGLHLISTPKMRFIHRRAWLTFGISENVTGPKAYDIEAIAHLNWRF